MPKEPTCKHCGDVGHYSTFCFQKPRKPILVRSNPKTQAKPLRLESLKAKKKRLATRRAWFRQFSVRQWQCYLQISPFCLRTLDERTVVLEHVKPRMRHPALKYELKNIKPACEPCNKLKDSNTLEKLAESYPQLKPYLPVDEWLGLK